MNIDQAKSIDICSILDTVGARCNRRLLSEAWYYAPDRDERTASLHVFQNGTRWFDFGNGRGGDIIDLIKYLFTISSTHEALTKIEDISSRRFLKLSLPRKEKDVLDLDSQDQKKKSDHKITTCELSSKLLMYSRSRGIHDNVIKNCCKQVNFSTSSGKRLYAIGLQNNYGGWELRNTSYKGCLGKKAITSFVDLADSPITVFEGLFDYLSCIEIGWIDPVCHNAVILNSTSLVDNAIDFFFSRQLILCLDNDASGIAAANKIKTHCNVVDDWSRRYCGHKDLNDFLMK